MAKRIAVFASGNGSNFQVIAEQFPVEFVFSDHRDAYVLERAKNLGVASHTFELKEFDNKAAYEEAEHAAKFAELLGEVVTDSTKKNLEMRVEAENGATAGKTDLAKRAKAANLDAIHDTVHEMARDEARHGKAFEGLLKRYFG